MQICARTILAMGFLVLGVWLVAQERTGTTGIWGSEAACSIDTRGTLL